MIEKKILIVCYSFPPRPGVGGRKWAKYAKYLKARGWDVTVLMATPGKQDHSPWERDAKEVRRIFLPSKYPSILDKTPKGVLEKLQYRLSLGWMQLITKSNYYDRAVLLKSEFENAVQNNLKEMNCRLLVVSGGPFSLLYYGALLKEKIPDLHYVADIRDDWTSDAYYGFGSLSAGRKQREMQRFYKVMEGADNILVSGADIREKYKRLTPQASDKVTWIPHAVDTELLPKTEAHKVPEELRLAYFGSLYSGAENAIEMLAKTLNSQPGSQLDIYATEQKYSEIFEKRGLVNSVHYHKPISEAEVFAKMGECSAVLVLLTEKVKDVIATKFIEIIARRVPILAIGVAGIASEFIIENRLGIFLDANKQANGLRDLKQQISELSYNKEFDYSEFTFENQVKILENIFNKEIKN